MIICNGGKANDETRYLFGSLPNVTLLEHDDSGFDIGGFQLAARTHPCDMMVFFGGNTYLRRPGWLNQMVWAWEKYGDCLYGSTGNQGDMRFNVFPHVRTTGFWCSPALVNAHPLRCTHNGLRYEYEHGATGLTTWATGQGKQAWIVAWSGIWSLYSCDSIPNGFRSGDGSNVLIGDRMTEPPYGPGPGV